MCMGWCPLEAVWGNWAEWAGAVATLVVGWAVWRVSVRTLELAHRTNELAESANATNDKLAGLESQRDRSAEDFRKLESTLILASISNVIGQAWVAIKTVNIALNRPEHLATLRNRPASAGSLLRDIQAGKFEIPESTRARLHYLPVETAVKILRVEGSIPLLTSLLSSIAEASGAEAESSIQTLVASLKIASKEARDVYNECQAAIRSAGLEVMDLP